MPSRLLAAIGTLLAGTSVAFAQPKPVLTPSAVAPQPNSGSQAIVPGMSLEEAIKCEPAAADGPCCDLKQPCGPPGRCWLQAEYLLWWIKNDQTPPLATTGPASFPVAFIGNPGTVVLNNSNINHGTFSGLRLWTGAWLNDCQTFGVEASAFMLGQRSANANFNTNTFPVLARPFFNQNTGQEFSEFVGFPGISSGQIRINSPSQLWGGLAGFRKNCCCGCWYRLDALGGFNYLNLSESLNIQESGTDVVTATDPGISFTVSDRFSTQNRFYGGYTGIYAQAWRKNWFLNLRGLVALGDTHQTVDINGNQTVFTPGVGVSTFRGGLLAEPSNIGHFTRDRFGVVPQLDFQVGRQLTRRLGVFVGYSVLYWNNVARPGGQIDRVIDVTQIPNFGATNPPTANPRPGVPFGSSDFWAQGISFGAQIRW